MRSLEIGANHLFLKKAEKMTTDELNEYVKEATDDRIFMIAELLRRGESQKKIADVTKIDAFFLSKIAHIVALENEAKQSPNNVETLKECKKYGFSDKAIARLWNVSESAVLNLRKQHGVLPVYKAIDSCASEFDAYIPYYYSTYAGEENEANTDTGKKYVNCDVSSIEVRLF